MNVKAFCCSRSTTANPPSTASTPTSTSTSTSSSTSTTTTTTTSTSTSTTTTTATTKSTTTTTTKTTQDFPASSAVSGERAVFFNAGDDSNGTHRDDGISALSEMGAAEYGVAALSDGGIVGLSVGILAIVMVVSVIGVRQQKHGRAAGNEAASRDAQMHADMESGNANEADRRRSQVAARKNSTTSTLAAAPVVAGMHGSSNRSSAALSPLEDVSVVSAQMSKAIVDAWPVRGLSVSSYAHDSSGTATIPAVPGTAVEGLADIAAALGVCYDTANVTSFDEPT
eukprot:gene14352-32_t